MAAPSKKLKIQIRGTSAQCSRWIDAAQREGRSVSNWGARVLDAYLASVVPKKNLKISER